MFFFRYSFYLRHVSIAGSIWFTNMNWRAINNLCARAVQLWLLGHSVKNSICWGNQWGAAHIISTFISFSLRFSWGFSYFHFSSSILLYLLFQLCRRALTPSFSPPSNYYPSFARSSFLFAIKPKLKDFTEHISALQPRHTNTHRSNHCFSHSSNNSQLQSAPYSIETIMPMPILLISINISTTL